MASVTSALLLTNAAEFSGKQLSSILEQLSLQLSHVTVVTQSGSLSKQALAKSSYDVVVSISLTPGHHTSSFLAMLADAARPGSRVIVQEPMLSGTSQVEGFMSEADLQKEVLLGGLQGCSPTEAFEASLSQRSVVGLPTGTTSAAFSMQKPRWEAGAKAAISLKPRAKSAVAQTGKSQAATAKVWALAMEDDTDELLDDEELLTEEDKQRPAAPALSAEDCSAGAGKKACKNCSCGRAEAEAAGVKLELTSDMLANPQSACGSCGLGDAFRCATCPYKGLPAFQMGKKIELTSDFLTADA